MNLSKIIEQNKVVQIMLLCLVVVVGYLAYRAISKAVATQKAKQQQDDEITQLEAAIPKGQQPTYPSSQHYKDFADKLDAAMRGTGTDFQAIREVFEAMDNDADIVNLKRAFGIRKGWGWFADDQNLTQWIQDDLSPAERKTINNILETKGITFKF